jgi:hypothetical protein
MDDVTEDGSSTVKFVSKRSMANLRAERSRQRLQTQLSNVDLELAVIEEPKVDAGVMALAVDSPSSNSTESLERKPVAWEAPMPKGRLIIILARYSHRSPHCTSH